MAQGAHSCFISTVTVALEVLITPPPSSQEGNRLRGFVHDNFVVDPCRLWASLFKAYERSNMGHGRTFGLRVEGMVRVLS